MATFFGETVHRIRRPSPYPSHGADRGSGSTRNDRPREAVVSGDDRSGIIEGEPYEVELEAERRLRPFSVASVIVSDDSGT